MPKTIQIRDVDDEVYAGLLRRAGEEGITVPELLRREAARLAARPSVAQWLARTGRRPSTVSTAEVLATLDEWRGDWPDARR
jgi:hypothetical protein